ncbi:RNA polymerase sigma factor [Aquisphaera insulae]|uniref:RNA polymerase sigma factor n=1 Tax=Aquisphaera insulae TaxID=2712864 RepID=UPI0013EA1E9D|nr:sigma-70 family RNA polymerase sigma factor [Aquisphaera insulae]
MAEGDSIQIQGWLDRLGAGEAGAREALIACAVERLGSLTRRMLRDYPSVRRWEQTDDVFQNAAMRLYRALGSVLPPTARDFYRLAAAQIRRELIDLARRHQGPEGLGRRHESWAQAGESAAPPDLAAESTDPSGLASWTEFHGQVDALESDQREVFDLLFYQGLSQDEAAALLGVSDRTIKRRWQEARLALFAKLGGKMPGL